MPETGATFGELQQSRRRHLAGYKEPRGAEFVSMLSTSGAGKLIKLAQRAERQTR